jgi:beta-glucosidase
MRIVAASVCAIALFPFVSISSLTASTDDSQLASENQNTARFRDPTVPAEERAEDLISLLTIDEKVGQLGMTSPAIPRLGIPVYNWWNEGLHGNARAGDATVFPQAIALAATWDPNLHYQVAEVVSTEAREKNNAYTAAHNGDSARYYGVTIWSPNINIFRDPRWGRGQETYGEDPFLTGRMATAYVQGLEGSNIEGTVPEFLKAVGTLKHFAVHSGPEPDRRKFDAVISEKDFRETYLTAFETGVRLGKAQSVMSAYSAIGVTGTDDPSGNPIGGIPDPANPTLLTRILRDEWGFKGAVVSDVGAISAIYQDHQYIYEGKVTTAVTASIAAIKAGTDLCSDNTNTYANILDPTSSNGLVAGISTEDVDRALKRLLTLRFRLGLFDPPSDWPAAIPRESAPSPTDREYRDQLALEASEKSLVLLKNAADPQDPTHQALPWRVKKGEIIAVIGPTMDDINALEGNYYGTPINPINLLQGITNEFQPLGLEIVSEHAVALPNSSGAGDPAGIQRAVNLVKAADHVVLTLGIDPTLESEQSSLNVPGFFEGDRTTIQLPSAQQDLLKAVKTECAAEKKALTVIFTSGSALAFDAAQPDAVLQVWYYGAKGGTAVAKALAGEVNPGGRLPITFYASDADLPDFTDYAMAPHPPLAATSTTPAASASKGRTYRYFTGKPHYAFGYGLSYTTFRYSSPILINAGASSFATPKEQYLTDDPQNFIQVNVTVTNTGSVTGDEVVQLYAKPGSATPSLASEPKQKLIGFQRLSLAPGQTQTATIAVNLQNLRRWDDTSHRYKVDAGTYMIYARSSSDTPDQDSPSAPLTLHP